ncbi:PAS domain S-box protein [Segetibacter sp. 3557_3]|uniref:PAS domain S-box protein n=1 Tax=Segetibacter sp. 3557_3 TaxID=2547429 RepID=UPI0010588BFB|nr:PAS domain S-box protein [Segetibacter sp. 3557_3]TDH24240.1 PAS domain S-box protein [Segetibacter sp. 3557_3]
MQSAIYTLLVSFRGGKSIDVLKLLLIGGKLSRIKQVLPGLYEAGYQPDEIIVCDSIDAVSRLNSTTVSLVFTELELADSTPADTLGKIHQLFPYLPIIVLAESSADEEGLSAIRQGAQDCLAYNEISPELLAKSILHAIERKRKDNDHDLLFHDNPAPMFIYEKDTFRFLEVNNAAMVQYGYSREQFLTMTCLDIRPKEDSVLFREANVDLPAHYHDFGRWRHVNKAGKILFVHVFAHTTSFNGKEAIVVMSLNIDKKVRVEQELAEREKEKCMMLDSITDAFFALDKTWKFTYVNKPCEKLFRKTAEEVLGRNVYEVFPDIKNLKFYDAYNRAMNDKVKVQFEEYYPLFDLWVSANAYPTNGGMSVYLVDITQQKKTGEEIFNEGQKLRAIINNTKDMIWSIDREHNVITANNAFWDRVSTLTGKPVQNITAADFDKILYHTWKGYYDRAFAGEAYKIVVKKEQGEEDLYEEVSFNPIVDRFGTVIGISCFLRNVTEQHTQLKLIQKQNEQLRKIAWIQSHEVRVPVANILGLTQLFDFDNRVATENKLLVEKLQQSATRLDNIIRKITSYTSRSVLRNALN